ncbi:MAG TPA: RluA family pseudouridine synthase [Methylomirabilota bacterium]|nr:RluA family pseudouridine synthase [Methylomirabilota bacterium]
MRSENFTIEQSLPRARLDSFLSSRFPGISRGTIQRLIQEGHILINGRSVKSTHTPRSGEVVSIVWPDPKPAEARPEKIPLAVLFEDENLLVLNKAPGIVVHPGFGNETGTLVNALLGHCRGELSGIGGVARPGIVHRLDKDTSGCLVVAKNDATHLKLSEQFAERGVVKIYDAILCGELAAAQGDIRAPIARHPTQRKRMAVVKGGREAWTSYAVVERLRAATLVRAQLHTGRTHQIRVHFQHLGFPLVGDDTYGKKQNARLRELTNYGVHRQMLHARTLAFVHPRSGKRVSFEAPWPDDFATAVEALRTRR